MSGFVKCQSCPCLLMLRNKTDAAVIYLAEHDQFLIIEHLDLGLQIQKVQPEACHPLDILPLMLSKPVK